MKYKDKDEIDALPLELQAKLLRVLESGEFERLGSPRTVEVDVQNHFGDEPRSCQVGQRGRANTKAFSLLMR